MNYLAHIHLSGADIAVAVGNFMGDGVKGRIKDGYPSGIRVGLHLHRFIDDFTDSHESNRPIIELLRPEFGRMSGIVSDMYYDHFLARGWSLFNRTSLDGHLDWFYDEAYGLIDYMPERQRRFFELSREGNWLSNYSNQAGIARALHGMSKRGEHTRVLEEAHGFLVDNMEELQRCFDHFYPQLQQAAKEELARLWRSLSAR